MALLLRLNVIALTALLLVPAAAQAQERQRLDSTVAYLQKVQHKDGGFGERGSRPGFSTWAALALASAGINPRDQRQPGGVDVYTYLTRNTRGLTQSTDFASMILVATASGTSPHRFGPVDPVARLLKLQRADGGFPQPPTSRVPRSTDRRTRCWPWPASNGAACAGSRPRSCDGARTGRWTGWWVARAPRGCGRTRI